jgi:hypothetical protein
LRGDAGTKLPVDAYFPKHALVLEYREQQHLADRADSYKLWDRKPTVSGMSRREQRAKYDQLRERQVPAHGLSLVVVSTGDLASDARGRLLRDRQADLVKLRAILQGEARGV